MTNLNRIPCFRDAVDALTSATESQVPCIEVGGSKIYALLPVEVNFQIFSFNFDQKFLL